MIDVLPPRYGLARPQVDVIATQLTGKLCEHMVVHQEKPLGYIALYSTI